MRKYQQLVLLLISIFSVGVLLMYKSENNRLKYVLKYVNFFGRNDAAVLRRLDNANGNGTVIEDKAFNLAFSRPLPVWQLISSGGDFYAYSSFWKRNELMAGGEAQVLVVGKKGAIVDFRCNLVTNGRQVQGKFRFQRDEGQNPDTEATFTIYQFSCQVSRDFGQPEFVSFTDAGTKNPVNLRLRQMKEVQKTLPRLLPGIVCVNLVDFNMTSAYARREDALVQFFLIHQALGVDYFLVYNSDQLPIQVIHLLQRAKIHLIGLPFNFPFSTQTSMNLTRQLIQTDCLMRSFNYASFAILLKPNEVMYPNARFVDTDGRRSLLEQLRHYEAANSRFELATFNVCFDERKKLLMDNVQYDPEFKTDYKMLLHRLQLPPTHSAIDHQVELALSKGFVHRYVDCFKVGVDGLHDWRSGIREDFMQHIDALRNEVDLLI